MARWDHSKFYDPEPDSYEQTGMLKIVTSIRHASFADGTLGLEIVEAPVVASDYLFQGMRTSSVPSTHIVHFIPTEIMVRAFFVFYKPQNKRVRNINTYFSLTMVH